MTQAAQVLTQQLNELESNLPKELAKINDAAALDHLRQDYFGKKGRLTTILKGLGSLSGEERGVIGKQANGLKERLNALLETKESELKQAAYESLAKSEWFDATVPAQPFPAGYHKKIKGHLHPVTLVQQRLEQVFTSMGFSIFDGPQVESDFYNFEALNFTPDHPAREMQDTFYTKQGHLLRTHTSPVQIRAMQSQKPPLRIIVPGRVFRYEEIDASHEHTFNQMEGMVIDREVTTAHLLFLMETLLREIFQRETTVRLRPGYFPFVEPGFELDMQCFICRGKGCKVCKQSGWVEVLPCGLVHPNVLRAGGLDPNQWQGAAFGLGLTRLAMLSHKIEDIRHLQESEPAFLYQF